MSIHREHRVPEIHFFMQKRILVALVGGRKLEGVLSGTDHFMNVTLAHTRELMPGGFKLIGETVVRGSAIVSFEPLESSIVE
eukprot:gnl/Chilomastix_caulleri/1595.p1 GENE.gnl/Chilomastix_caulleri/1595~~gnl/Chilomastix_caulleri/1595.p1  ORF type:complete len:82 (+),score=19.05 gnl/Chilomastix_caulleri/1595:47-292(+)